MKILIEKPPIYEKAKEIFDVEQNGVLFTYGDTIYNPSNTSVDKFLIAHEETHMRQQLTHPGGPEAWWADYIADVQFRAEQEVEAYGNQYKIFCEKNIDRNSRSVYLHEISRILSSGLYAGMMGYSHARSVIKESSKSSRRPLF